MKKTLAAVAVLGAFAGSAIAADVTLYGIVDAGLQYNHIDMDGQGDDIDTFSMESGQQSGSRWGLKGTEDLGNGLTVGFVLENGFTFDDGNDKAPMFDRESMLFLEGGFGKLAFGRIGTFNQGQGSFSQIGGLTPFGTSWGYAVQAGTAFMTGSRYDNSIVYQTPSFAGFQVTAMYSMGGNDEGENESTTDRYYGVAASYKNGPLFGYLAVDSINYASYPVTADTHDIDDKLTVTLGASYNFEVVKAYFGAQYFDNAKLGGGITSDYGDKFSFSGVDVGDLYLEGYALTVGVDAPVAGGKLMAAVGYMDAETASNSDDVVDADFTRWSFSVGYDYPLSKRTNVYAVGAYTSDDYEGNGTNNGADWNPQSYTLMLGMRHKF